MVLERASAEPVGAGFRDRVDLAADVPAELRAVAVGLDAELAHRFHPERGAGGAARRAVGEVVQQRAVEQIHVGARVLPVHAHREPVRDDRPLSRCGNTETPGCSAIRSVKFRPLTGIRSMARRSTRKLNSPLREIERWRFRLHGHLVGAPACMVDRDGGLLGDREPEA